MELVRNLFCISEWQLATVPPNYAGLVQLVPNSLVPHPNFAQTMSGIGVPGQAATPGFAASPVAHPSTPGGEALPALPTLERAGLIWAVLDPSSTIDIEAFLSGYDDMLSHFNFDKWYLFDSRVLRGPNWKVAYDGYLDFYHLPVLHGESFGRNIPNTALF